MKNLFIISLLISTLSLHAEQPYTVKWGEEGDLARFQILEGCFPVSENVVCCYTSNKMLLVDTKTLKEIIKGDIPLPASTGNPNEKEQIPITLYSLEGKIWLVSAIGMNKDDTRLFLSSINPSGLKNNNDSREIGSVQGRVYTGSPIFKTKKYIPADSSGILLAVNSKGKDDVYPGIGKDRPLQCWFINKKGKVDWQWESPLEELVERYDFLDFVCDKNNNLVFLIRKVNEKLKDWNPDQITYTICSYNPGTKKFNRTNLLNENHYYTKPILKACVSDEVIVARFSYDAKQANDKKPDDYINAGITMSRFDANTQKLTSSSSYLSDQNMVSLSVKKEYSSLVLIYLEETHNSQWAYAVEARGSGSQKGQVGNIMSGRLDAGGKTLSTALLSKSYYDLSDPASANLWGSVICYSNPSGNYCIYNEQIKDYNNSPTNPKLRDVDHYKNAQAVVALAKDNSFTKSGIVFQSDDQGFCPYYSRQIAYNKFLVFAVKYMNFSNYRIGILTFED